MNFKFHVSNLKLSASAAALISAAAVAAAADRTRRMHVAMYLKHGFEKRAAIDSAVNAYIQAENSANRNESVPDKQIPLFRAAAAEWKKYIVQFEFDFEYESVKAYVQFMQGLSSKGARDRNAAIKTFRELIDFYPGEEWLIPAARFMIGDCQTANGEQSKAKATFIEMITDPASASHPLTARANCRLASMAWTMGKADEACNYWRAAVSPTFKQIATWDYNQAFETLIQAYAIVGKWKQLTEMIYEDIDEKNTIEKAKRVRWVEDIINGRRWNWNNWWYDVQYVDKAGSKDKAWKDFLKGYSKWHEEQRNVFSAGKMEWEYYRRAFNYRNAYDKKEAKKLIKEMTDYVRAAPKEEKDNLAKDLCKALAEAEMYVEAHSCAGLIGDPLERLWAVYGIDLKKGDYNACVLSLEQIIANKNPEASLKGKKELAWLYKDRIHDYEKALKIYQEISVPPGTLWDIQYCFRRLKKTKEAMATLQELTFFPDHAARATWTMAEYYREDGDKDRAVALYRRLLSQPEWKKTGESSQAHQRLEAWGIATGGGVVETIR